MICYVRYAKIRQIACLDDANPILWLKDLEVIENRTIFASLNQKRSPFLDI